MKALVSRLRATLLVASLFGLVGAAFESASVTNLGGVSGGFAPTFALAAGLLAPLCWPWARWSRSAPGFSIRSTCRPSGG